MKVEIYIKGRGYDVEGLYDSTTNQVTINKNGKIRPTQTATLGPHYKKLRENLVKEGVLSDNLIFLRDFTFSSKSTAASIVSGSQSNPRKIKLKSNNQSIQTINFETPDFIEFLKEKISNDKNLDVWKGESERISFLSKFNLDNLNQMTLEDYCGSKNPNSLIKYITSKTENLGSGNIYGGKNQLFFQLENGDFDCINYIKNHDRYIGKTIREMFEIFKKDLYDFLISFNEINYSINDLLPEQANIIKVKLVQLYLGPKVTSLTVKNTSQAILDYLGIQYSTSSDALELNCILTAYLKEKGINNVNFAYLSTFIWEFYKEFLDGDNSQIISIIERDGYSSADFDLSIEVWKEILLNTSITSKEIINLIYLWFTSPNHECSPNEMAERHSQQAGIYTPKIKAYGKAVFEELGFKIDESEENSKYWPAIMDAREGKYKGNVVYRLRKDVMAAFEELLQLGKISFFNIKPDSDLKVKDGYNLIVYGVPGSGKSHYIQKVLLNDQNDENIIRTTFYHDYSYGDFVGQIMPIGKLDSANNTSISYEFVPGLFTLALEKALKNPTKRIFLVIEEINRGNAPAIFGEVFQLLDRNIDGTSKYKINNSLIQSYLSQKIKTFNEIVLPSNLFIFATMNTSDQNVFPLDNAFKRRWSMHYISAKPSNDHEFINYYLPSTSITWGVFLNVINEKLISNLDKGLFGEDKQIGPYFVTKDLLSETKNNNDKELISKFAFKVLSYLWTDISRADDRSEWFQSEIRTLDELLLNFQNKKQVFSDEISHKLSPSNINA